MTPLGLLALVALGTGVSFLAAFVNLNEPTVEAFLAMLASVLWGAVALSAFDVTLVGDAVLYTQEWTVFVILGVAMAFLNVAFVLYKLMYALRSETADADLNLAD